MVLKTPTRALPPRKRKWILGGQQCKYSLRVFIHAKLSYRRNLDLCFIILSNHWTKLLLFLPSILHRFTVLPTCSQTCMCKWYTHTHTHTPYSFLCHCCSSFPSFRLSSGDSQYFQGCSQYFHSARLRLPWLGVQVSQQVFQFSSVQWLSCVRLSASPWITAHQASLFITNSWSLPQLMNKCLYDLKQVT